MKWARPNLMKAIQLTQWGAIIGTDDQINSHINHVLTVPAVVVYGVLFLELPTNNRDTQERPFNKVHALPDIIQSLG